MAILINCKDSVRGHIEVLYEHLHNIVKRIQGKGKIKSTNLVVSESTMFSMKKMPFRQKLY